MLNLKMHLNASKVIKFENIFELMNNDDLWWFRENEHSTSVEILRDSGTYHTNDKVDYY